MAAKAEQKREMDLWDIKGKMKKSKNKRPCMTESVRGDDDIIAIPYVKHSV